MERSSIYINRISITCHGLECFGIDSDNVTLCDWIVVEVLQTLFEELHGIITRITGRLIVKFKERI